MILIFLRSVAPILAVHATLLRTFLVHFFSQSLNVLTTVLLTQGGLSEVERPRTPIGSDEAMILNSAANEDGAASVDASQCTIGNVDASQGGEEDLETDDIVERAIKATADSRVNSNLNMKVMVVVASKKRKRAEVADSASELEDEEESEEEEEGMEEMGSEMEKDLDHDKDNGDEDDRDKNDVKGRPDRLGLLRKEESGLSSSFGWDAADDLAATEDAVWGGV